MSHSDNIGWFQRWRIHQSVKTVQLKTERIIANNRFLQKQLSKRNLADEESNVVNRKDFEIGKLLGRGTFAQVFDINYYSKEEKHCPQATTNGHCANDKEDSNASTTSSIKNSECSSEKSSASSSEQMTVVIKQLHPEMHQRQKRDLQKFEQAATDLIMEVAFLSRLRNENIVQVQAISNAVHLCLFGHESDPEDLDQDYFFVMERVPETLDQRIRRWKDEKDDNKFEHKELLLTQCYYALQIASVCSHLQEQRLIYRDLKSSNIGLNGDTIKLFDFGACRELPLGQVRSSHEPPSREQHQRIHRYYKGILTEEIFLMSMVGTQRYLAPEVMTTRYYNGKADVYSWAILVAEIFSLEEPFSGYTQAQHFQKVAKQEERPLLANLGLPHSLEELIRHSWATDISIRPTMAQVKYHTKQILQNDIRG